MSKISDAHTALVGLMGTLFPLHNRLSNAYKIEENNDLFLRKGWAIGIFSGNNTERKVGCKFSINRIISITFTRKYEALENDPSGKSDYELELMEDQYLLVNELEQNPTLDNTVPIIKYIDDSGIQYIRTETDRYLMLQMTVSIEYLEPYT